MTAAIFELVQSGLVHADVCAAADWPANVPVALGLPGDNPCEFPPVLLRDVESRALVWTAMREREGEVTGLTWDGVLLRGVYEIARYRAEGLLSDDIYRVLSGEEFAALVLRLSGAAEP